MFCRWVQELLGYHFTIAHIRYKMIINVYVLTRRFGHLISHHIAISDLLSSHDRAKRPHAYAVIEFSDLGNVNITETGKPSSDPPPILTSYVLHRFSNYSTTH